MPHSGQDEPRRRGRPPKARLPGNDVDARFAALSLAVQSYGPLTNNGTTDFLLQRAERFYTFLAARTDNPISRDPSESEGR